MIDYLKNKTVFRNKYKTHSEAVIISCFFNPQNSSYRLKAFQTWYESIKHLNHRIIECVIGDGQPQLLPTDSISIVRTPSLLWHKESLLNKIIEDLPDNYRYVFWVDADVIFQNKNWLVDGVKALQENVIIQPFEYCVHLDRDETEPSFEVIPSVLPNKFNNKVWRSFCANYNNNVYWRDADYNNHGHVGFAWAARREILNQMPLYDRALIGGADHIIAHAAVGQINHSCILKSFTDNLEEVAEWSRKFHDLVKGRVGYVSGNLYHIWHGDIEKRQYLKRIQDFTEKTKEITRKDENGLYVDNNNQDYMLNYFLLREVTDTIIEEPKSKGFGGGEFGGGGASGSYENFS